MICGVSEVRVGPRRNVLVVASLHGGLRTGCSQECLSRFADIDGQCLEPPSSFGGFLPLTCFQVAVLGHWPNWLPWDFASDGLSRSQASLYFIPKGPCVLLNRVRKTAARRILGGSRVAAVVVARVAV